MDNRTTREFAPEYNKSDLRYVSPITSRPSIGRAVYVTYDTRNTYSNLERERERRFIWEKGRARLSRGPFLAKNKNVFHE